MSALTRTPISTDLLQPTKYTLSFAKISNVQYFCQSANIPGIKINPASFNTMSKNIVVPVNKMEYNNFSIKFLIDEKLSGWQQLHTWFRSIASPEGFSERQRLTQINGNQLNPGKPTYYSDATLTIMSALNNPIIRVQFFNVIPISLSDIDFDTSLSADEPIISSAEFMFDYFNFVPA